MLNGNFAYSFVGQIIGRWNRYGWNGKTSAHNCMRRFVVGYSKIGAIGLRYQEIDHFQRRRRWQSFDRLAHRGDREIRWTRSKRGRCCFQQNLKSIINPNPQLTHCSLCLFVLPFIQCLWKKYWFILLSISVNPLIQIKRTKNCFLSIFALLNQLFFFFFQIPINFLLMKKEKKIAKLSWEKNIPQCKASMRPLKAQYKFQNQTKAHIQKIKYRL